MKSGIYNYLSQARYLKSLTFLLLMLIFILLGQSANEIFSDQNLYYYLFSTIVQGFLALVAFLGAVAIYKLQIIETDLSKVTESLVPDAVYYRGTSAKTYSWIEMMNELRKILDDPGNTHQSTDIKKGYEKLESLSKDKGNIRTKMVDFALLSFFNVSLALIGLPLAKLIVNSQLFFIGFLYVSLNILISIVSLFFAWQVIRTVMGYSFSREFRN